VNFAIAETGGVVVCTNEGNADMGTSVPPLHIACMGVEKVVPRLEDLAVLVRLLARSATGQPITSYTSHFHGPVPGGELHIVIVDNGRSRLLANPAVRGALACIRCGACMNTCPVFRRSGGYSYGWVVPGPIGSILASEREPAAHASLPFASTLCGSCDAVCPVKIDLHGELLVQRRELAARRLVPLGKRLALRLLAFVLAHRAVYEAAGRLLRLALRRLPRALLYVRWNAWGRRRELPPPPEESFRETWRRTRGGRADARGGGASG
jgi:L-lactate dehydrogenase complex protein LldF